MVRTLRQIRQQPPKRKLILTSVEPGHSSVDHASSIQSKHHRLDEGETKKNSRYATYYDSSDDDDDETTSDNRWLAMRSKPWTFNAPLSPHAPLPVSPPAANLASTTTEQRKVVDPVAATVSEASVSNNTNTSDNISISSDKESMAPEKAVDCAISESGSGADDTLDNALVHRKSATPAIPARATPQTEREKAIPRVSESSLPAGVIDVRNNDDSVERKIVNSNRNNNMPTNSDKRRDRCVRAAKYGNNFCLSHQRKQKFGVITEADAQADFDRIEQNEEFVCWYKQCWAISSRNKKMSKQAKKMKIKTRGLCCAMSPDGCRCSTLAEVGQPLCKSHLECRLAELRTSDEEERGDKHHIVKPVDVESPSSENFASSLQLQAVADVRQERNLQPTAGREVIDIVDTDDENQEFEFEGDNSNMKRKGAHTLPSTRDVRNTGSDRQIGPNNGNGNIRDGDAANVEGSTRGPYTYTEFLGMWTKCEEEKLHQRIDDIEATHHVRGANSRMCPEDTDGQAKAQYGRLLPLAMKVSFCCCRFVCEPKES